MSSTYKGTFEEDNIEELTEDFFKKAVKGIDGLASLAGEDAVAFLRKRGRPKVEAPKRLQSFKLSPDVIIAIKATGKGFNARVEAVLREAFIEHKAH